LDVGRGKKGGRKNLFPPCIKKGKTFRPSDVPTMKERKEEPRFHTEPLKRISQSAVFARLSLFPVWGEGDVDVFSLLVGGRRC